jgi:hypothetical protein
MRPALSVLAFRGIVPGLRFPRKVAAFGTYDVDIPSAAGFLLPLAPRPDISPSSRRLSNSSTSAVTALICWFQAHSVAALQNRAAGAQLHLDIAMFAAAVRQSRNSEAADGRAVGQYGVRAEPARLGRSDAVLVRIDNAASRQWRRWWKARPSSR